MQPIDLQRLFQEHQDVVHAQLGIVKVFAMEHCVSSVKEDVMQMIRVQKIAKNVTKDNIKTLPAMQPVWIAKLAST